MIAISLNGQLREVPQGTLLDLLTHLKLKKEWTLVEHNGKALNREDLDKTWLQTNDAVEIVRAVAGG